jgi:uncharacterized protein with GYD domain
MNAKRKGWRREDQARKRLEKEGYYVTRSGASLGAWDLIAIRREWPRVETQPVVRLIQVKSNRPPSRKEMAVLRSFNTFGLISREVWIYPDREKVRIEVL